MITIQHFVVSSLIICRVIFNDGTRGSGLILQEQFGACGFGLD